MSKQEIGLGHEILNTTANTIAPTVSLDLGLTQYMTYVDASAGGITVALPLVTAVAGKIFMVYCTTITSPNEVTVTASDASSILLDYSLGLRNNYTLTAAGDYILAFSTGRHWVTVARITT